MRRGEKMTSRIDSQFQATIFGREHDLLQAIGPGHLREVADPKLAQQIEAKRLQPSADVFVRAHRDLNGLKGARAAAEDRGQSLAEIASKRPLDVLGRSVALGN